MLAPFPGCGATGLSCAHQQLPRFRKMPVLNCKTQLKNWTYETLICSLGNFKMNVLKKKYLREYRIPYRHLHGCTREQTLSRRYGTYCSQRCILNYTHWPICFTLILWANYRHIIPYLSRFFCISYCKNKTFIAF